MRPQTEQDTWPTVLNTQPDVDKSSEASLEVSVLLESKKPNQGP